MNEAKPERWIVCDSEDPRPVAGPFPSKAQAVGAARSRSYLYDPDEGRTFEVRRAR